MKISGVAVASAIGGVLVAGSLAFAGPALAAHGGNAIPGEPAPAYQDQNVVAQGQPTSHPASTGSSIGLELPIAPVGSAG